MSNQNTYMISRTTVTVEVFAVKAARPLDAGIEFGRLVGAGEASPVSTRVMSVSHTSPTLAITDPSADADVDGADDHQDGEQDKNGDADNAGSGAHVTTGTPTPPPATQRRIVDSPQA